MKKYGVGDNQGFAGVFGRLVEVFGVSLENGCILFEDVINVHPGSSPDPTKKDD